MLIIVTSVCSIFIFITATMLCLCWRKKTEKNDLLGLDGLVTQMNPDENVNHLPATISNVVPDDSINANCDAISDAKRSVTLNNSRRSLPDIPLDGLQNASGAVNYERNGDNTSDLYATVEPYTSAKRHTLPNGIDARPSISQHSSISQADDSLSPYARVKEHPYAKLKTEHPYAHVQPSSSRSQEETALENSSSSIIRGERLSTSQPISESVASRSPRSSEPIGIDIPAASAVAGGIAASQELPYMTPPIQQNFSGDSQDSSKGYTSISVREPLANIRAQTKGLDKAQRDLDPHYSTVSDDSDDVYTTIQDPNNIIYTSESETYAQIQPPPIAASVDGRSHSPEVSPRDRQIEVNDQFDGILRPVSTESRKNGVNTHSRQASSSSSVANVGSPKPEKRQANSPLPPTPPCTSDAGSEKSGVCKTLDDMYAKVQKSKKRNEKEEDLNNKSADLNNIESLVKPSSLEVSFEEEKPLYATSSNAVEFSLYTDHNYETLRKTSNPKYEKLKLKEAESKCDPGYDVINAPNSIINSDPGYEAVKHGSEASSEEDPNYEELRHRTNSLSDSAGYSTIGNKGSSNTLKNDGYSVVQKKNSDDFKSKNSSNCESELGDLSIDEPNYESMPNESLVNHNYTLLNSEDVESDPNYESVCSNDPNYESVKFLDETIEEPPYERLHDEDSSKTDSQQSNSDLLQTTTSSCENSIQHCMDTQCLNNCYNRTDRLNVKENPDPNSNVSIQFESDFDGIVQV